MTFLHMNLLVAGMASIALPILIHILLRRRRQPVMWGAMRFLMEAYQQQRRRVQLEQLLILACRCLLIALIAAAIARPFFKNLDPLQSRTARTLYVVLDDTLASSATGADGASDFASLQAQAAELFKSLDESRGDRAALITLSAPAESRVSPPSSDPAAVLRLIAAHTPSAAAADWNQALAFAAEAIAAERAAKNAATPVLALLTSGRAGSIDVNQLVAKYPSLPADTVVLLAAPATSSLANTAIMDVAPLRPVLTAAGASSQEPTSIGQVRVSLTRFGVLAPAASKLKLELETSSQKSLTEHSTEQQISWAQGQAQQTVILNGPRIKPADASRFPVLAATIDRDSIEADNMFRAPLVARDVLRVALVASRAQSKLLSGGSIGSVDQFSPADWLWIGLDPGAASVSLTERGGDLQRSWIDPVALNATILTEFDVLVIAAPEMVDRDGWTRVRQSVDNGAVLMVFPPAGEGAQNWSDAFIEIMKLDVRIAREAQTLAAPLSPEWNSAQRPAWDPLHAIAPEAVELFKPVHISRFYGLTTAAGRSLADVTILGATGDVPVLISPTLLDNRLSRGVVYVSAVPMMPEWTDLPTRPLFVPVLQELLRSGMARASQDSKQVAGKPIRVPIGAVTVRVKETADVISVDAATGIAASVRDVRGLSVADSRGAIIASLAINADTAASDVTPGTRESSAAGFKPLADATRMRFIDTPNAIAVDSPTGATATASIAEPPAKASLLLFALAAVCAVIELVLGRIFSHAQPSRTKSVLDMSSGVSPMEQAA